MRSPAGRDQTNLSGLALIISSLLDRDDENDDTMMMITMITKMMTTMRADKVVSPRPWSSIHCLHHHRASDRQMLIRLSSDADYMNINSPVYLRTVSRQADIWSVQRAGRKKFLGETRI